MRDPPVINHVDAANTSPVDGSRHINRRPSSEISKRTGELVEIARILPHCSEVSTIRALPHSDHPFCMRKKPGAAKVMIIAAIATTISSSVIVNPVCCFRYIFRRFTKYLMNGRDFGQNYFSEF